jgi:hypothetical protein
LWLVFICHLYSPFLDVDWLSSAFAARKAAQASTQQASSNSTLLLDGKPAKILTSVEGKSSVEVRKGLRRKWFGASFGVVGEGEDEIKKLSFSPIITSHLISPGIAFSFSSSWPGSHSPSDGELLPPTRAQQVKQEKT